MITYYFVEEPQKRKEKKSRGGKIALAIFIVVVILTACTLLCGYLSRDDEGYWFKNPTITTWSWYKDKKDDKNDNSNGVIVSDSDNEHGISLMSLDVQDTFQTVEAVLSPDNVTERDVSWALRWKDNTTEYATAHAPTEFLEIAYTYDTNLKIDLKFLGNSFNQTVELVCTSMADRNVYGIATVDYLYREMYFWNDGGKTVNSIDEQFYVDDLVFYDGSLAPNTIRVDEIKFLLPDELYTFLRNSGITVSQQFIYTTRDSMTEPMTLYDIIWWGIMDATDGVQPEEFRQAFCEWGKQETGDNLFAGTLIVSFNFEHNGEHTGSYLDEDDICVSRAAIEELMTPPSDVTPNPGEIVF